MTDNPYQPQIEAGAVWLDENIPDWVQAFAEDQAAGLHMEACHRCVIGYVLGSYWDARSPVYRFGGVRPQDLTDASIDEMVRNWELLGEAVVSLGFTLPTGIADEDPDVERGEWELLGRGWQELITKRLADQGLMA